MKTTVEIPDFLLEDAAVLEPETQVLMTLIRAWLARPESRRRIKNASEELADAAHAYVHALTPLRLPESTERRRVGFARWLSLQVQSHEGFVTEATTSAVEGLRGHMGLSGQAQFVAEELLGAELRRELARHLRLALASRVIQEHASHWVQSYLGATLQAGIPQKRKGLWLVPVLETSSALWVTTLRVAATGEFLSDPQALHAELTVRLARRTLNPPFGGRSQPIFSPD